MVQKQSTLIEIGSGEDGHYDWISEFSILEDLQHILIEMESVDRNLKERKLSVFLTALRKQDPNIPKLEYFDDAFDLIKYHPAISVDGEFFDPDMPVSSIWSTVFVKRSSIPKLIQLLESAKEKLETYCERENVPELLKHQKDEADLQRRKRADIDKKQRVEREREDQTRRKREDDEWVETTFSKVEKAIKRGSRLEQIDAFLIDSDSQEIFVLTIHKDYQKARSDREFRVTQKLMGRYIVYEIEEGSSPGSRHIPYFAGAMRRHVMGWRQNKSVLFCANVEGLQKANRNRNKYLTDHALDLN